MGQVRDRIRQLGLSCRTEEAYCGWIRRFILHHGKRHPREMGAPEVGAFLTDLARRRGVAASTRNQALAALLFLYREVLGLDLPWLGNIQRAKRPVRVPTVLSRGEVGRVLAELPAPHWLIGSLLYGAGLRLLECLQLRIQDVDFARNELTVRHGKGGKDRRTVLPRALVEPLQDQVSMVREIHRRDRLAGFGRAVASASLQRKLRTSLEDPGWQFVSPATGRSRDPRTGLGRVVTGAHGRSLIGHG
jgi:integron integrase